MTSMSDEELMGQYKLGNYSAFEELYSRHSSRAYGYLLSKTRDAGVAQDLLQVSFMKLHEKRSSYDRRFKFMPWFFTIIQNNLRDYFRSRRVRGEVSLDEASLIAPSPISSDELDLENMKLSEAQKQALRLRYEQDLEFAEIARVLDSTSSNVRQLISRALRSLRGGRE